MTWLPNFLFPGKHLRNPSSHLFCTFLLNSLLLIFILNFAESLVWLDPFSVMDSAAAHDLTATLFDPNIAFNIVNFCLLDPVLPFHRNIWFTLGRPLLLKSNSCISLCFFSPCLIYIFKLKYHFWSMWILLWIRKQCTVFELLTLAKFFFLKWFFNYKKLEQYFREFRKEENLSVLYL